MMFTSRRRSKMNWTRRYTSRGEHPHHNDDHFHHKSHNQNHDYSHQKHKQQYKHCQLNNLIWFSIHLMSYHHHCNQTDDHYHHRNHDYDDHHNCHQAAVVVDLLALPRPDNCSRLLDQLEVSHHDHIIIIIVIIIIVIIIISSYSYQHN